jgi:uncharacterized protein with FMN-binding domain
MQEELKMRESIKKIGGSLLAIAIMAAPVAAKAPSLTDLVGAKASSGEMALEKRGYVYITGNEAAYNTKHSYWWNSAEKHCAHVETYDGQYTAITDGTRGDCNQKMSDGDAAAAIGAVAGVGLIVGLLSHKSHHKQGATYDQTQTQEFEYGYRDGLYNASYHNNNRSDAYARGYEQGVNERNANMSHHTGHGGYAKAAKISDIKGMNSIKAFDVIIGRGFTNVDSIVSGNTTYGVFYNRETRQCVQMTNADQRVYDIRDIGTHPNCR